MEMIFSVIVYLLGVLDSRRQLPIPGSIDGAVILR